MPKFQLRGISSTFILCSGSKQVSFQGIPVSRVEWLIPWDSFQILSSEQCMGVFRLVLFDFVWVFFCQKGTEISEVSPL